MGCCIIKRIIKYIIVILIVLIIIFFSIFNNKNEDEEIVIRKEKPTIIEETEKMVYLIDKKNSNVDELLKDNITVKYETVYICEEEPKEEVIEPEQETVEEISKEEPVVIEEPIIEETPKEETEPVKEEVVEEVIEEPKEEIKNGLIEEDGYTYYYENNEKKKGIINNQYFDDNYKLRKEFEVRDNKIYYENNKGLHLVDGIRYYFDFNDGHLVKSSVKSVIDISSWQGDIDFNKLKESNLVDGVIVRVGYGTSINSKCGLDKKFERNISELNRLGIPYGIYIYGYAQNEVAANIEANFVYGMIKKYNVNLYYPVFYDAELRTYNGVSYTKSLYTKVINAFTSNLESKGIKTGVYGNLYMLTKGSLNDPSIRNKDIWVAQYYNKCQYDTNYIGWQYSSKGSIPGISGRVDVNIFNY